jgi:hypothetical protein
MQNLRLSSPISSLSSTALEFSKLLIVNLPACPLLLSALWSVVCLLCASEIASCLVTRHSLL